MAPTDDDARPELPEALPDDSADEPDPEGLSLDVLTQAFASHLAGASDAVEEAPAEPDQPAVAAEMAEADEVAAVEAPVDTPADDSPEISPRVILEALLFVGHPENDVLSAEAAAATMRGVEAAEIDELVAELNATYDELGCPYHIIHEGAGFRLTLREDFRPLREKFYGKVREARLSQASIDVLAIVAYHQGMTRDEVDEFRGKPSSALLRGLVRRQLLRIERDEQQPKVKRHFTTDRFLALFQLTSIEDLPRSEEIEVTH